MPDDVTAYAPVPTMPGDNPEADAYNVLVYALNGDWKRMRAEANSLDRYELEQSLAMSYAMLSSILHSLPPEVGCRYMTHFETTAMSPGSPLTNRIQRNANVSD